MTEQEIKLMEEGMWVSGYDSSLKEKLFYALYCGPVKINKSIQSEEEKE